MEPQSQDIEKQRHTQGGPRPTQTPTPPHDRPPGQPHDPPPQSDQDPSVERTPTQGSPDERARVLRRRRKPQSPS